MGFDPTLLMLKSRLAAVDPKPGIRAISSARRMGPAAANGILRNCSSARFRLPEYAGGAAAYVHASVHVLCRRGFSNVWGIIQPLVAELLIGRLLIEMAPYAAVRALIESMELSGQKSSNCSKLTGTGALCRPLLHRTLRNRAFGSTIHRLRSVLLIK
jgi:hypothetical protein